MRKTFVMRGQTASGQTEVLNFGKYKAGYAYKITEFQLYHSTNIGAAHNEMVGSITAGKVAITPTDVNFNDEGLIATALVNGHRDYDVGSLTVINDTFLITQNLILMVQDTSGTDAPVNWQCRFESVKNLSHSPGLGLCVN